MRATAVINVAGSAMPIFLLLLLIWILPVKEAEAQRHNRDAVYLKAGSVVTGSIIQYDSVSVRISNDCGIWKYNPEEVDSVSRFAKKARPALKDNGYYNLSSIGLLFGEGANGYQPLASLTMVNGWQFKQRIFTGIGVGYEFYDWGVLPLFADIKYFFSPDVVTPFVSLKVGYSFPLSNTTGRSDYYGQQSKLFGGVLLNPELGLSVPVGSHNAFVFAIGYHYQELSSEEPENQWYYYQSKRVVYTHYNRISLRVGFVFQ